MYYNNYDAVHAIQARLVGEISVINVFLLHCFFPFSLLFILKAVELEKLVQSVCLTRANKSRIVFPKIHPDQIF